MNKLSILEEIVLYLINRYNGERTIQGLTYLLKGKQSAQIIQDSHFYHVTSFFGLFHFLTQQNMQDLVNGLFEKGLLQQLETNVYIVSEKGQFYLKNQTLQFQNYTYLNGLKFFAIQKTFWKRFSLFFQSIANLNNHNKYFKAVQQEPEIQDWVKKELLNFVGTKESLINDYYQEIHKMLKGLNNDDASLFVMRLSGANSYGMTLEQIAAEISLSEEAVYLQSINVMHHLLFILSEQKTDYPLLSRFMQGANNVNITTTSIETKRLFLQGKTIEQIASIRNLKISTIEDHIVECVLSDEKFPIDQFINEDQYKMTKEMILELNTRKLKTIKEALFNKVTYFQIRITLARMGDLKWN
ncbi:helix-turn-helix domain-containing protein [Bacillus sp. EAC]|uniref:helix-turn-helix domain-containing protein n=1 Tax=Bacillus sp. EAC TaxID=1978338 RepID=UPI000B4352FC|nr:helix-turn-helix domain-containing protein [Bacillus sp. EAC]